MSALVKTEILTKIFVNIQHTDVSYTHFTHFKGVRYFSSLIFMKSLWESTVVQHKRLHHNTICAQYSNKIPFLFWISPSQCASLCRWDTFTRVPFDFELCQVYFITTAQIQFYFGWILFLRKKSSRLLSKSSLTSGTRWEGWCFDCTFLSSLSPSVPEGDVQMSLNDNCKDACLCIRGRRWAIWTERMFKSFGSFEVVIFLWVNQVCRGSCAGL